MKQGLVFILLPLFAAGVLFTPLVNNNATAHETRERGSFEFIVGFLVEPAYEGQSNAAFIAIAKSSDSHSDEEGHRGDSNDEHNDEHGSDEVGIDVGIPTSVDLQVEISYPATNAKTVLPAVRTGEIPGTYQAEFIPTAPGTYSFRFFGKVDGVPIDETFIGGPGTFSDVRSTSGIEFPVKLASSREVQNSAQGAFDLASSLEVTVEGNRALIWSVLAVSVASLIVAVAVAGMLVWRIRK